MDPVLPLILAAAAGGYVLYRRIRLCLNQRLLRACQQSAVVIPPSKPKTDVRLGFVATAVLLLALAVLAMGVIR